MSLKKVSLLGLISTVGLSLIIFGFIIHSAESHTASQTKRFHQILTLAQGKIKAKDYGGLKKHADEWIELSGETQNHDIKWKSLYAGGTANLEMFIQDSDEKTYLKARRNLRDALRESPHTFEPKYNLTYLENRALEKGIKIEEIPVGSNEDGRDALGQNDGIGPAGDDEKEAEQAPDFKDKITSGRAPGLGGEPLLDLESEINPEDIPEKPAQGY